MHLLTLPNELLLAIASFLPHPSIYAIILTNRRFHHLLEPSLYKNPTPLSVRRLIRGRTNPRTLVTFQRLLSNGLDLNMDLTRAYQIPERSRMSPLAYAIVWNRVQIARLMLETGLVDVEEYDVIDVTRRQDLKEGQNGYCMMELLEEFGLRRQYTTDWLPCVRYTPRKVVQPNGIHLPVQASPESYWYVLELDV